MSLSVSCDTGPILSAVARVIAHLDLDAFFAAVEELERPELARVPLIVGGDPHGRGVVATANYVARKYGIHSAMSCAEAYRRCPECVFIKPDFPKYHKYSQIIRSVFYKFTDLVEPLSLDEAYMDVTVNKTGEPSATRIAAAIKKDIFDQTSLTASA